jgi:hypothetical protein
MQSKYIDEDFGRQLVEKKLNEMEMAPSDLDTSRINRAIGGGAILVKTLAHEKGMVDLKLIYLDWIKRSKNCSKKIYLIIKYYKK